MTIPNQQRALFLSTKHGSLKLGTTNVPKPKLGEVLVRIETTALNPIDWIDQDRAVYITSYPAILGLDAAGVIVDVGEGVHTLDVGDRVLHQGGRDNRFATFQQYAIVPSDLVTKIPANISFDQAASVPIGVATAALGLYNTPPNGGAGLLAPWLQGAHRKYAGQPIVILGGSSSVGQYVLQFAKLSGFSPIITTVSPRNNQLVKSLGATHAIDRHLSPSAIVDEVQRITPLPIRVIYDAIAEPDTQNTAYEILAPGGRLVVTIPSAVEKSKLTPDKEVIKVWGSVYLDQGRPLGLSLFAKLNHLLKVGDIKPNPVEVIPGGLAGIEEGLEWLKTNKVSGHKLIVHPQETA